MIEQSIQELIQYGIEKELITSEDEIFLRNQLMDLLQLSAWETPALPEVLPTIDEILDKLVSYAAEKGIITDSNAARDLFDTRIMGLLTERPHTVNRSFFAAYHRKKPQTGTISTARTPTTSVPAELPRICVGHMTANTAHWT